MSAAWMDETAAQLARWGGTVTLEETVEDGIAVRRHRIELGTERCIVLETLSYPDGIDVYWLEIVRWSGIDALPYRLDSWKHHADRVELKLAVDPESGMGFSLTIRRDALTPPCPS